jgi:LPXTG-motif cell wall-anchored protein
MLTVDDITAPLLVVVNQNYKVERNAYTTVNQAILANVVAFDYTDDYEDLSIYVSNNGGMVFVPGTYTVEVTVEDAAGNSTSQSFTVTVTPAKLTIEEVQALLDAQTITAAEIQAMIDAQTITAAEAQALLDAQALTEAEIQALIDASIPETGCGSSINLGSSLMITMSLVLGAALVFVFKRRR